MQGLKKIETVHGPVLVWDTSRWEGVSRPMQLQHSLEIAEGWEDLRDLVIYTRLDNMDMYDDVAWYFGLFDYRVYGFVMAGDRQKMRLYTKQHLEAKYVPSNPAHWVPVELLAATVEAAVEEHSVGLYPLIGKAFRLWELAEALNLPGKPFEERATGVQYSEGSLEHYMRTLNENALSFDRQLEFWQMYSEMIPFSPDRS